MSVTFQKSQLFKVLTGSLSDETLGLVNSLVTTEDVHLKGAYEETYLHCLLMPRPPTKRCNPATIAQLKRKKQKRILGTDDVVDDDAALADAALEVPHDAYSVYMLSSLIHHLVYLGVDVNSADFEGNTPLHIAALNDVDPSLVMTFLRLGADPHICNKVKINIYLYLHI